MPGAQKSPDATLRTDLMELVVEYNFEELGLMAEVVAPTVLVSGTSGEYPVLPREVMGKIPDTRRQSDGSFRRGTWDWNSDSYFTREYGYEMSVDLTQALRNRKYIDEEAWSAALAKQGILLNRESRVASALMNETTFSGTANLLTLTNEWDDASNATPWANVEAAAQKLLAKCGIRKKFATLVLPSYAIDYVVRADEIINNAKYTENLLLKPREVQIQFLASYFGVKNIIEVASLYDASGLGKDASFAEGWNEDYGMLCVIEASARPNLMHRSVIIQPTWSEYAQDLLIEDYRSPETRSHVYRALEYRGIKVRTDYGVLIKNLKTA